MAITDRLSGAEASRAVKAPCYVASTGNLTLSSSQTIDGILAFSGARVLVKDQTDATENGIYLVDSSSWTRAKDFDKARDIMPGTLCYVDRGTVYGGSYWVLNSSATSTSISIGTAALTFSRVNTILAGASTLGSSLVTLQTGADMRAAIGAMGSAYLRVFSTSATWTKPTGLIGAYIQIVGGGGGGGAAIGITGGSGGGGGAGGYAAGYYPSSDLSPTHSVTIGAGGTTGGTTSTGNTNGSSGGNTSFGTLLVANGGGPGIGSTTVTSGTGGTGGNSTAGTILAQGGHGLNGSSLANSAATGQGGNGGPSFFGSGGRGGFSAAGSSGLAPGAGGAGGNSTGTGGVGAPGAAYVLEFTATST